MVEEPMPRLFAVTLFADEAMMAKGIDFASTDAFACETTDIRNGLRNHELEWRVVLMSLHLDHLTSMCTPLSLTRWLINGRSGWKDCLMDMIWLLVHMLFMSVNGMPKLNSFVRRNFFTLVYGWRYLRMSMNKKGNMVVYCPIASCSNIHQPEVVFGKFKWMRLTELSSENSSLDLLVWRNRWACILTRTGDVCILYSFFNKISLYIICRSSRLWFSTETIE